MKLNRFGKFNTPVYVTSAPGYSELVFVVEQAGRVKVLRDGRKRGTFLNVTGLVMSNYEEGMFSLAFHPRYKRNRLFYVFYVDNNGNLRVDEFKRRSALRAARRSRRPVMRIRHQPLNTHNADQLQFLGRLLYISIGDGGGPGDPGDDAKSKRSLLGKILRINPRNPKGRADYSVPRSNPFVGRRGHDAIFSYGLRNPWRFSFDTVSAAKPRIVIADVGQEGFEEVDYEKVGGARGTFFGWDEYEGVQGIRVRRPLRPQRRATDLHLRALARLHDHRRLRGPRPAPELALWALPLHRPLPRQDQGPEAATAPGPPREPNRIAGEHAGLLRRGLEGPRLRHIAAGPGLPHRSGRLTSGRPAMLKWPVPKLPIIRSHSGRYISVPRAEETSPRSTIRSSGQPNSPSRPATSRLASSSSPHTKTACSPGTIAGLTITSQFIVFSALTTRTPGSWRWICSPRLSVLQMLSVGGIPCEKSSGLATSTRTLPERLSAPAASSAASEPVPAVQLKTISP